MNAEPAAAHVQVKEDDAADLQRGTRITLHLKEDAKDLADAQKLGSLIKQYSEFIQFPITLWASKTEYDQVRLLLTVRVGLQTSAAVAEIPQENLRLDFAGL